MSTGARNRSNPGARRYPLQPLADVLGVTLPTLGRRLGVSGSTWKGYRDQGVTELVADRLCGKVGLVPYEVWPEMLDHAISDEKNREREMRRARYLRRRDEILERQRAYDRAQPDVIRRKNAAYYRLRRQEVQEKNRQYYEANREKRLAQVRNYYQANRERILKQRKLTYEAARSTRSLTQGGETTSEEVA